jgi:hypothetical protein
MRSSHFYAFASLGWQTLVEHPEIVMSVPKNELNSAIPDLRELSLESLAALGDSVLANSIALYRQRLGETGVPLSSFNARI